MYSPHEKEASNVGRVDGGVVLAHVVVVQDGEDGEPATSPRMKLVSPGWADYTSKFASAASMSSASMISDPLQALNAGMTLSVLLSDIA